MGDLERYKIEKGAFTKGYAITYSNDIHRVVSISHHKAKLDNQKEYKFENLQKVPEGLVLVNNSALARAEQSAK